MSSYSKNQYALENIKLHLFKYFIQPFETLPDMTHAHSPIVIGGMGGSGTRPFIPILRHAGIWMGNWVNPITEDAMATRYFLQHHFEALVNANQQNTPIPKTVIDQFHIAISTHCWHIPEANMPWGWKNPRTMWVIPFLAQQFPNMKFIHVIRDGRDMALTQNQNLLRKHGSFLLKHRFDHDPVISQLRLWMYGNQLAKQAGEKYLGQNYLLIKYEDLCTETEDTIQRLFDFIDYPFDSHILKSFNIHKLPKEHRWYKSEHPLLHQPSDEIKEALSLFGYDPF